MGMTDNTSAQPRQETPGVAGNQQFAIARRNEPSSNRFAAATGTVDAEDVEDDDFEVGICPRCDGELDDYGKQSRDGLHSICVYCADTEANEYPYDDEDPEWWSDED